MPNAPMTISLVAGLDADGPTLALDARKRQQLVDDLRDKARLFRQLSPFDLGERLLAFLAESLRKPVAEVFQEVWTQRQELREAAAEGRKQKDVESEVGLYDHEMKWVLHPAVELRLGEQTVGTMTFDVEVELALSGLVLIIKNASITSIKAGELKSTVTLKYKDATLLPASTNTVELPGRIDFPKGGLQLA